jgi:hypothetical protein
MKKKVVKAEDCVNGNCEVCEAAEMPLDHKLMNAFMGQGMRGVMWEIQKRETDKKGKKA